MAIEAASRGASPVVVVDRSRASIACIHANATAFGVTLDLLSIDAVDVRRQADLVYLDPPYRDPIGLWLERAAALSLRVLVAEARAPVDWPKELPGFSLDRARTYGDTAVALYVRIGATAGGAEVQIVGDDRSMVENDGGGEGG